jgi:hypothetical protein
MTERLGPSKERREHPRKAVKIPFFCYVDGQRFDTDALDLSPGGAFLRTDESVRIGAPVLLLPKVAKTKKAIVLAVGHVVRQRRSGETGLGIRWAKVISRGGVSVILKLADLVPDMFPKELPAPTREFVEAPVVGYSFKGNDYFLANAPEAGSGSKEPALPEANRPRRESRVPAAQPKEKPALHMAPPPSASPRVETHHDLRSPTSYWGLEGETTNVLPGQRSRGPIASPAAKREVVAAPTARPKSAAASTLAEPDKFSRTVGMGPLTEVLTYEQAQMVVSIRVQLKSGDKRLDGVLLRVGMNSCFVASPEAATGDIAPNQRVDVQLKIDLQTRVYTVTLCCRLQFRGLDPMTEREGMVLTIKAVEQPSSPGLFERYVKYLYYQLINNA